jgi:topoisomerase-4 subunit A
MYIDFKLYSDREALYKYMYDRFEPFSNHLWAIVDDDLQRLTQIPMIRITRFDSDKAMILSPKRKKWKRCNLEHLTDFAIAYFTKQEKIRKRRASNRIANFDDIEATKVVLRNTKLYVNREEGFYWN